METYQYMVRASRVTGKRYEALHAKHVTTAYDAGHALNTAAEIFCVGHWQRSPAVKTQSGAMATVVWNQDATYMIYVKQQRAVGCRAGKQ